MAIVNLTPDSFFDGGNLSTTDLVLKQVEKQLEEGAYILDLGAASSRPGSEMVPMEEEWNRLEAPLKAIRKEFPDASISIDTWRAEVAERALNEGAHMINDISANSLDSELWNVVARWKVPYVLMHMQGKPQNMQEAPEYVDVVDDQILWFAQKRKELLDLGLNDIILDPGFGFGKTVDNNYQILKELDRYHPFRMPILVGVSRKSMICKVLRKNPEEALNGTTAVHSLALFKGAHLLRVHDVKEAMETIKIVETYKSAGNGLS